MFSVSPLYCLLSLTTLHPCAGSDALTFDTSLSSVCVQLLRHFILSLMLCCDSSTSRYMVRSSRLNRATTTSPLDIVPHHICEFSSV